MEQILLILPKFLCKSTLIFLLSEYQFIQHTVYRQVGCIKSAIWYWQKNAKEAELPSVVNVWDWYEYLLWKNKINIFISLID